MMSLKTSVALGLLLSLSLACSEAAEQTPIVKKTPGTSNSQSGKIALKLSWAPQSTVSSFHIYYVDDKLKTREIDSLQSDSEAFDSPEIAIDDTNMESWPSKGAKACFYVVADAGGVLSDPSDKACIVL